MNKLTLAINAWRAYSAVRRTEGSSLRGKIIAGISVVAVAAITLLRGDLTAADVGAIAVGISGLDAVLAYLIPDQIGQPHDARPPINLVAKSQAVLLGSDPRGSAGDGHPDSDQLRPSVRPGSHPDPPQPMADDFPGWGS